MLAKNYSFVVIRLTSYKKFMLYFPDKKYKKIYVLFPALCHTGSRIYEVLSILSKVIGDRGGERHSTSAIYSVKLCVIINCSLSHNVLCFSFIAVLYSIYSLYAVIKMVLLDERGCHV